MKNLYMIACVSQDLGIGKDKQLLWTLKPDMQFFRTTTLGHPIVMGGTTYASIGKPLPGRKNIVLSRSKISDQVECFQDKAKLDAYLATLDEPVFIIGGASLYQLYLPEAEKLYLTEVAATKPADTFFPEFDPTKYDKKILAQHEQDGVQFQMVEYALREPS